MLESVEHARDDFAARRLIELHNKADADLRHTEKGLARSRRGTCADRAAAHRGGDGVDATGHERRRTADQAARGPRRAERGHHAAGRTNDERVSRKRR